MVVPGSAEMPTRPVRHRHPGHDLRAV